MSFNNEKLIEILNDAFYDYTEDTTEEWLTFSLPRENNSELEFNRLMRERSVSDEQIEQLKIAHGIDSDLSVAQVLEHFISALGGEKWTAEEAAVLRSEE
tara:strand:+ start:8618 stop:8917 length:300 start_codon:yes stop_codon:yes gene_type:complete